MNKQIKKILSVALILSLIFAINGTGVQSISAASTRSTSTPVYYNGQIVALFSANFTINGTNVSGTSGNVNWFSSSNCQYLTHSVRTSGNRVICKVVFEEISTATNISIQKTASCTSGGVAYWY